MTPHVNLWNLRALKTCLLTVFCRWGLRSNKAVTYCPSLPEEGAHNAQSSSSTESVRWSLAALEATALQQNPAILQASASAQKAFGYRNQVGRKPNPILGYQGQQLADAGTDQHLAYIEQDIVMGDKLRKNQSVLNQEIQSQLWEVETQRKRVLTDVRQRFYERLLLSGEKSWQSRLRQSRKKVLGWPSRGCVPKRGLGRKSFRQRFN